jgi:hypothetical protein
VRLRSSAFDCVRLLSTAFNSFGDKDGDKDGDNLHHFGASVFSLGMEGPESMNPAACACPEPPGRAGGAFWLAPANGGARGVESPCTGREGRVRNQGMDSVLLTFLIGVCITLLGFGIRVAFLEDPLHESGFDVLDQNYERDAAQTIRLHDFLGAVNEATKRQSARLSGGALRPQGKILCSRAEQDFDDAMKDLGTVRGYGVSDVEASRELHDSAVTQFSAEAEFWRSIVQFCEQLKTPQGRTQRNLAAAVAKLGDPARELMSWNASLSSSTREALAQEKVGLQRMQDDVDAEKRAGRIIRWRSNLGILSLLLGLLGLRALIPRAWRRLMPKRKEKI